MAGTVEKQVHHRRRPHAPAALAALLALVLLGLWIARKPIAQGQADRYLAQAGVPARYAITELGPGRQRLTGVVIGDAKRPDLVADWIETRTAWSWRGPYLAGVRGGRVRVRARWNDGRLTLGSLDRLAPRGKSAGPVALPRLALDVADLRARIETPWGLIGAKLSGQGLLDGGFDGRLAVAAARLDPGCGMTRPEGVWRVRTTGAGLTGPARIALEGSGQAAVLACAGATAGYANANGAATLTLGDRLGWAVTQDVAMTDLRHPAARARLVTGRIALAGAPGLRGPVVLRATGISAADLRAAEVTLDGALVRDAGGAGAPAYDGAVRWTGARYGGAALGAGGAGTPIAPLLRRLRAAAAAAALDFAGAGAVHAAAGPNPFVRVAHAVATSRGGATLRFDAGPGPIWSARDGWRLSGAARLGGGGLPAATVRIAGRPDALAGMATVAPYAAGEARLALTPVRFRQTDAGWRVTTRVELSGPLPGGRVDGLALPLDLRWRAGGLALAGGCAPLRWRRLAVSGLRLDPATLRLCPTGGALVTLHDGRLGGGATLAATRLTGRLASTPLAVTVAGARARLAERGFSLDGVEARLGRPDRITRLSLGTLDGRTGPDGLAGTFARAGGRIGAVPLALSAAAGRWRFAGGALAIDGAATVADAAGPARFQPMAVRAVAFRLVGDRITATGALHEPTTGARVAAVAIRHDLSAGAGDADLTVADLAFVKGFQPELLTRLTFGVIAEVRGTVSGEGRIAWSPAGVTSTGAFRTEGIDLAAAFGPVTGLAGAIQFTDLLALQSAPGQRVTVKSINPGVPVTDGVIRFQTLPGTRVQVEGARWPFAGGALTLEPTLLDFSGAAERRMTFRVQEAAADKFLQSFDFKNLNATGVFDGVLPMAFDTSGGRIAQGRLTVRPGGGTIAYVGDLSRKNLGFWADTAFGALRSLRYRSLNVLMNGPLAGEMVTEVRFAGVSQGVGARRSGIAGLLVGRLQRLPFVFNIRIRAPFRGLLDATASFYDPRLVERNLPDLIQQQNRGVQPPATEAVP